MDDKTKYESARTKMLALKGFYRHLFFYCLFNLCFFIVNIRTSPEELWFFWPLIFWGIALLSHASGVFGFGFGKMPGKDWEENKIKEFMERDDLDHSSRNDND